MQGRRTYLIVIICLFFSHSALSQDSEPSEEIKSPADIRSEIKAKPVEKGSCIRQCLEAGENREECHYVCVRTV